MTPRVVKPGPFADVGERIEAGRLGMWVFLAALAMLFAASIIGFIVIRFQDIAWPEVMPSLPPVLWASTGVLMLSSVTMEVARAGRFRAGTTLTFLLGVVFLLLQTLAWWQWRAALAASPETFEAQAFALVAFNVLTGVHAVHVIGGLIPLGIVTVFAWRGRYTRARHPGVAYCGLYWHFLDGVWLVLLLTLLIGV